MTAERGAHRDGTEPSELVRQVLAEVLGSAPRLGRVDVLQTTTTSSVLRVVPGRHPAPLVVKLVLASERPRVDLERTATVMARGRMAGVPVPQVLAADGSGRIGGWQYLVLAEVAGVPWRAVVPRLTAGELADAQGQIATAVLQLQSVRLDAFGELDQGGHPAGVDLVSALRHRARLRIADPRALTVAEQLLDDRARVLAGPAAPVLCHDDLHHQNLLFAPTPAGWQLAAVLDWDKAWAGPAESDLARLAFWDGMTGPGFWSVYRAARPVTDGEDERLLVHQLLWCLEYPAATARHRADTVGLCRRLGLRPPDER